MTSYLEFKRFHYLFEIEKKLENLLSKPVINIIYKYKGFDNHKLFLENTKVKCRMQLQDNALKLDMYDKKKQKWSNGNIYFAFNFNKPDTVGIGTTMPPVDIGTTMPPVDIGTTGGIETTTPLVGIGITSTHIGINLI